MGASHLGGRHLFYLCKARLLSDLQLAASALAWGVNRAAHRNRIEPPFAERAPNYLCRTRVDGSWNEKNLGTLERVLRVLVGALAIVALVLLLGAANITWQLAHFALIVLGIDFVVTGIPGYCPLYNWVGWSTAGRTKRVKQYAKRPGRRKERRLGRRLWMPICYVPMLAIFALFAFGYWSGR